MVSGMCETLILNSPEFLLGKDEKEVQICRRFAAFAKGSL
jgi:hypothetical protein